MQSKWRLKVNTMECEGARISQHQRLPPEQRNVDCQDALSRRCYGLLEDIRKVRVVTEKKKRKARHLLTAVKCGERTQTRATITEGARSQGRAAAHSKQVNVYAS